MPAPDRAEASVLAPAPAARVVRGPAAPAAAPGPAARLARFEDVVALARAKRDIQLVQALEQDVRLDRFEQGSIAFSPGRGRVAGPRADAGEAPAGMDRRALDGGARAGLDRADPARDADRARGGAGERRRGASGGAQGARALQGRPHRRGARAGSRRPPAPPSPPPDDDVGYADAESVDDDDL